MTPEEEKAAEIDRMLKAEPRADDAGKLDKVLRCLDGMSKRMDAVEMAEKPRGDAVRKADASDDDEGLDEPDEQAARR